MDAQFSSQDQNSSPSSSTAIENSLTVLQFVELVRGERKVREPHRWGTVSVKAEEKYCLECFEVTLTDVVMMHGGARMKVCRRCHKEDWG